MSVCPCVCVYTHYIQSSYIQRETIYIHSTYSLCFSPYTCVFIFIYQLSLEICSQEHRISLPCCHCNFTVTALSMASWKINPFFLMLYIIPGSIPYHPYSAFYTHRLNFMAHQWYPWQVDGIWQTADWLLKSHILRCLKCLKQLDILNL